MQLRVQLERQRPMRIDLGVVRWVKGAIAAIEFIRMTQEDQIRLRRYVGYVEKRPQPSSLGVRRRCAWAFRRPGGTWRDHEDG